MLKYLATNFNRSEIEAIGFDLDGTLYDEFDFISQLFSHLAKKISALTGEDADRVYRDMLALWLGEGNHKNFFQGYLLRTGFQGDIESVAAMCVSAYRNFSPKLKLSPRITYILEYLKEKGYGLFLISDGNCSLQRRKINALGLNRFFAPENIAITGYYGAEFEKPSTKIIPNIKILRDINYPARVLYVGDRELDTEFAVNAGFRFVHMKNSICLS